MNATSPSRERKSAFVGKLFIVLASAVWIGIIGPGGRNTKGQSTIPAGEWGGGFQGFSLIARSAGLRPVSGWEEALAHPDDLVCVIFGTAELSQTFVRELSDSGASVLVATDSSDQTSLAHLGIRVSNRRWSAVEAMDRWQGFRDCPVVRALNPAHPVTKDVGSLVTNRPAVLTSRDADSSSTLVSLAKFPLLQQGDQRQRTSGAQFAVRADFAVAGELAAGGRIVVLSDPSVFCNQMIIRGDNALFSLQALDWLRQVRRTRLAVLVDGEFARLASPDETQIQLPPPTREEIFEALRNLPADELIEFGNTVATMVEDEGLVNEFLATVSERMSRRSFRQVLITAVTLVVGFLVWHGFLSRDSVGEQVLDRSPREQIRRDRAWTRASAAAERRYAATALLRSFQDRIRSGPSADASSQASFTGVRTSSGQLDSRPARQYRRALKYLGKRPDSWWQPRRLRKLESQVREWTRLHELGLLVYDGGESRSTGKEPRRA